MTWPRAAARGRACLSNLATLASAAQYGYSVSLIRGELCKQPSQFLCLFCRGSLGVDSIGGFYFLISFLSNGVCVCEAAASD